MKMRIKPMKMSNIVFAFGLIANMSLFASWLDRCPPSVFNKVKDNIVIITGDKGSGTGFIVDMDGSKWLMTNEHVVRGQGRIRARTLSGRKILPTNTVDIASNRDLIRYKIDWKFKALKIRPDLPSMNEDIWVFGNSDGSGVVTSIGGDVIGLAGDKIEVSAKFVAGNSGSPVVDNNGEVVGVATFAEIKRDYNNWVKSGTRFNDVRRFAETLHGIVWEPLGYEQYLKDCADMHSCLEQCFVFLETVEATWGGMDGKPEFKRVMSVKSSAITAINKDKKSRKVYNAIVTADSAYEKAVKVYENTKKRMRMEPGKIGRPSESKLKRCQKDIDTAYQAVLKSRKDGLAHAKMLIQDCVVKSELAKVKLEDYREIIEKVIAKFDELCNRVDRK